MDKAKELLEQKTKEATQTAESLAENGKATLAKQQAKLSEAQNALAEGQEKLKTTALETKEQVKTAVDKHNQAGQDEIDSSDSGRLDEGFNGLVKIKDDAIIKAGEVNDGINKAKVEGKTSFLSSFGESVETHSKDDPPEVVSGGKRRRKRRKKSKKNKRWPRKKSKGKKSRRKRKKKGGRKSRKKKRRRSRKKSRRRRRR